MYACTCFRLNKKNRDCVNFVGPKYVLFSMEICMVAIIYSVIQCFDAFVILKIFCCKS